ncbi:MAG: ATP-binding protein [Acidimicrobiales bacterium]
MVTVVFADLAGFTTMAEGRDPEAVKELLDTCFGALVPVIEEHGGTVDKIIGDEVMAVFGAPLAHEDDPERAVRAGVALLAALEALDPALEMRVGINTGEVLAGPVGPGGAYTVTGDTVNTAHRLVGAAPPGTVLVAERTHAVTADAIAYGPSTSYQLRGRREPVLAHSAIGARHRPGQTLRIPAALPLVGRASELARLTDAVLSAIESASPAVVTVVGEAGLGKTRLLDELVDWLGQRQPGVAVAATHCAPYGSDGPLTPLADLVRHLLALDDGGDRSEQRAQVGAQLPALARASGADAGYLGERIEQLLGLRSLPSLDAFGTPGRGRLSDELVSAARLVLDGSAAARPLVVIVDDAHFADPLVVEALDRAVTWARQRPMLIVVAGREELLEHHPDLGRRDGGAEVLGLEPLDEQGAGILVQHTLVALDQRAGPLDPAVVEHVLRATGGNPLLLDQLVRHLWETGAIAGDEEGWRATRALHETGIPDGARSLLGARLDALPGPERALLQRASVVGRSFTPEALSALGDPADDTLLTLLWRRGLVVAGNVDGELAFRHALVREAAYASVPLAERATQHERLARWLLEGPGSDGDIGSDDGRTASVAHHLERAVTLTLEVQDRHPELDALAGAQLLRAARSALGRDALDEAARWFERAVALEVVAGDDAAAAALDHGAALLALRRLPEARDVLGRAVAVVDGGTVPAEALAGLGVVARLQGDAEESARCFTESRRRWQVLGDLVGEARSVRTHGWAELMAGRPRAARPKLLRALDLEDASGSPSGVTLQCLAWSEFLVGEHAAARAHLWDAAGALSLVGDRPGLAWCFSILGNSLWQEGRVHQARGIAENLLASASQGDPWGQGMARVLLAGCLLEGGDLEGCRREVATALRSFDEMGDPWGDATARLVEGMLERVAGDLPAARRALEQGLVSAARVAAVGAEARLRAELAATSLDLGDEATAAREARATLGLVRSGGGDRDSEIRALVVLAKRAQAMGADADAGLLLEEAVGLADGAVRTSIWRRAVAMSALLAADEGATERAERLSGAAADGAWESARTWVLAQRARAAAQRAAGQRRDALATLESTIERFSDRPLAFVLPAQQEAEQLRRSQATPSS